MNPLRLAHSADVVQPRADRDVAMLGDAVAASGHPVCVTDATVDEPGPRIVSVNQAYLDLFCCDVDDVVGASPRIGQGPLTNRAVLDRIRRALVDGVAVSAQSINYRLTGEAFRIRWSIDPIVADAGDVTNFFALLADVTAEDRLRRRLIALDSVTSGFREAGRQVNAESVAGIMATAIRPLVDELGSAAVRVDIAGRSAEAFAHGRAEIVEERVSLQTVEIGTFGSLDIAVHPDALSLFDAAACTALADQAAWSVELAVGRGVLSPSTMIG